MSKCAVRVVTDDGGVLEQTPDDAVGATRGGAALLLQVRESRVRAAAVVGLDRGLQPLGAR